MKNNDIYKISIFCNQDKSAKKSNQMLNNIFTFFY